MILALLLQTQLLGQALQPPKHNRFEPKDVNKANNWSIIYGVQIRAAPTQPWPSFFKNNRDYDIQSGIRKGKPEILAELQTHRFFLSWYKITVEQSVVEQVGSTLVSAAGHVSSEKAFNFSAWVSSMHNDTPSVPTTFCIWI